MRAASQLPGKGPTDVDDAPAPARKSKIQLWLWLWCHVTLNTDMFLFGLLVGNKMYSIEDINALKDGS